MKSKIFGLFAFSIFALVFLMGFASAAVILGPIELISIPSSVDHAAGSFNIVFNLTNTGTISALNWSASTVTSGASIAFNDDSIAVAEETITATVTFPDTIGQNISGVINVTNATGITYTTLSFSVTTTPEEITLCNDVGNPGELKIKDIDFTNNGLSSATFGDDKEWFPFEEIEVEIDVENDGSYDIDNIEVSWGLYDVDADEWVVDFDEEDEFNIKDGDTETFTVSFKLDDDLDVDLEDFSDDADNYRLYVVADGTIDDSGSPHDGNETCAFDYEPASIIIESDFVILDNIQIPEVVQCGADVQVTANVWNIGEDDQEDITIIAYNQELGINAQFIIDDIDAFDSGSMDLTFAIPGNAEEKTYSIKLTIYDEDHDVYENDYDGDRSIFSVFLEVEGNCGAGSGTGVLISASLESEAKAGKDLTVKAIITNNEDELKTFTVSAAGFAQWASSFTVDRTNLILSAGESANVLFTFDVNKDASGSQSFTIELVSEDNQVTTQPVSVNIESARPLFGITGLVTTDNAYLWGIGLLNIILIVIIIIVAVRIARRK